MPKNNTVTVLGKRKTQKKYRNKTKTNRRNKKYKKNTRRGGQFTEQIKRTLGINRFRPKSILPKCSGFEPRTENPRWNHIKVSEKYLDTYDEDDDFLYDKNNILFKLFKKNKEVATDLRFDCNLLRKYLLFWNQQKYKIIDWYQLGKEEEGKRRLIDFIIKMHKKLPLSDELKRIWNNINIESVQQPVIAPDTTSSITSEPIVLARKPPEPIDPKSLLHYVQNPQQYNNPVNWDRNSIGDNWKIK